MINEGVGPIVRLLFWWKDLHLHSTDLRMLWNHMIILCYLLPISLLLFSLSLSVSLYWWVLLISLLLFSFIFVFAIPHFLSSLLPFPWLLFHWFSLSVRGGITHRAQRKRRSTQNKNLCCSVLFLIYYYLTLLCKLFHLNILLSLRLKQI